MTQTTTAAPASVSVTPPSAAPHASSAVADASIAAYVAAGERMRIFAGWAIIACLGGMLLFVIAVVMGVIPVRLF